MADLPRIFASTQLPGANMPRTNPRAFGSDAFEGMAHVAAIHAEADIRRRQANEVLEASERDLQIARRFEDVENMALRTAKTSDEILPLWQQGLESIKRDEVDSTEGNELAKRYATLAFNRRQIQSYQKIRGVEEARWKDESRGRFFGTYKQSLRQLGALEPGSPEYEFESQKINGILDAIEETPVFTAQEMATIRSEHEHQKELNRAYYLLEKDPERLKNEIGAESYQNLTGSERNALKNHAEAALSEKKRLIKEAEQERLDGVNAALLARNVAGQLKISDVMQLPQEVLPFKDQRFWVDRLQQQQEQKAAREEREREKVEREQERAENRAMRLEDRQMRLEDRAERIQDRLERRKNEQFEKSDGNVRAQVLAGVLTNPQEWNQAKIMSYMGNGLSIAHTEHLVGLQKELTKGGRDSLGNKYEPLNQALDTLDGLRKSYAFTKEGLDEKVTDSSASAELRIKNDEEYNRVVDQVVLRSKAGESPRAVLNELMQPYFSQKTKSWQDWAMSWMFGPLKTTDKTLPPKPEASAAKGVQPTRPGAPMPQDLDQAAREFLQSNGKLITPETLKRTKEYLKSRR